MDFVWFDFEWGGLKSSRADHEKSDGKGHTLHKGLRKRLEWGRADYKRLFGEKHPSQLEENQEFTKERNLERGAGEILVPGFWPPRRGKLRKAHHYGALRTIMMQDGAPVLVKKKRV